MAGTYTPWTGHINISSKNTYNDWLTITNYQNDEVIIDGTNCPTYYSNGINSVFEIHESNYIRISGLTINHSASAGIACGVVAGEDIVHHIRIDNCTISNCSAQAIKSKNGNNNITFEYNYLFNNFNNWTGSVKSTQETVSFENVVTFSINNNTLINNRAENIDMKGGCSDGEVCYNTINNTADLLQKQIGASVYYGGPAIMVDARGLSHNISIYNNNIFGNASGITLNTETDGHYEYIYIYNNVINLTKPDDTTTLTYPLSMGLTNSGSSSDTFHHIYIYSNTISSGSNNNYNLLQIGHYSINRLNGTNLNDLYLYNNVFATNYDGGSYAIGGHFMLPTDITMANNSFYRGSGTLANRWDETAYSNQTAWNFGDDANFSDPKFVDSGDFDGDYHIESDSPLIGKGNTTLIPSYDFDDVLRATDNYCIGAYEYDT